MTNTDGLVQRLAAIPYSGAISDILDEAGLRHQTLPPQIQALHPGSTVAGRALTLVGAPTDTDDPEVIYVPFLRMLGDIRPGEVLVAQPNDHTCSHLGELSAETAQYRGARGAVIDGGCRDVEYIGRLRFPVFARYTTPCDIGGRWYLVDYRVAITIGNVRIESGDYIVGDADGVCVIPQDVAEEVIAAAEEVVRTEDDVRKAVLAGMSPLDAYRQFGRF